MSNSTSDGTVSLGIGFAGNLYGYQPSKAVGYVFTLAFAATAVGHTWVSFKHRAWWLLPTVVAAAVGDVLGWVFRTIGAYDPGSTIAYAIQGLLTILAPTFLIAALFIIFGRITALLGQQYSRFSPGLYSKIFLTIDIIALFIQGAGGGLAASAKTLQMQELGNNTVLGGIIFQLISLTVFTASMVEFYCRHAYDKPVRRVPVSELDPAAREATSRNRPVRADGPMKQLIYAVFLCTFFLYVRSVYRTIEFAEGYSGAVIRTQWLFAVFDGVMVLLALLTLLVIQPTRILSRGTTGTYPESVYLPVRHGHASE